MAVIVSADDDPDIREYVRRVLIRDGHQVLAVPDGVSALALIREQRPDMVVLDVDMPGMNGLEVCRTLRADPEFADLPVVIASGSIAPPFTEVIAAGASDMLPKPYLPQQLRDCVGKYVVGKHESGAPA